MNYSLTLKIINIVHVELHALRLTHNPFFWRCCKASFDKGSDSLKLCYCLVSHAWRTYISYSPFSPPNPDKMAKILLYSNENINIRHPPSQSPTLLASHLNISYLQDTSQLQSSGLLSPAQETTGKSETCHTASRVMCHEGIPSRNDGNELSRL